MFVCTVNVDFAVECLAGDIFQLGNASWRILRVNSGVVRVEDAKGQPPGIPFWLGEAPARTAELSEAVSNLRTEIEQLLAAGCDVSESFATDEIWGAQAASLPGAATCRAEIRLPREGTKHRDVSGKLPETAGWQPALPRHAAEQIADYFADTHRALGAV